MKFYMPRETIHTGITVDATFVCAHGIRAVQTKGLLSLTAMALRNLASRLDGRLSMALHFSASRKAAQLDWLDTAEVIQAGLNAMVEHAERLQADAFARAQDDEIEVQNFRKAQA